MAVSKQFSTEEILGQSKRILNSQSFKNSPILSRFLEFIIHETINNNAIHIKEYSVAINVLNKSANFNPHDDAVVRIHAGRLRRALTDYYLTKGIYDTIVIDMPKGSYIPKFYEGDLVQDHLENISINGLTPDILTIKPTVAILPFKSSCEGQDVIEFCSMLETQLIAGLSRFHDISVIGYYSTEITAKIKENILEAGKAIGADFLITGYISQQQHQVRLSITVIMVSSGEVLLSRSCEKLFEAHRIYILQDEIIQTVIASIGGYNGLILKEKVKASPTKFSSHTYIQKGINQYYQFQKTCSAENYYQALSTLKNLVNKFPDHAGLNALLGELYVEGIGIRMQHEVDPLQTGYEYALTALKLDPLCQQAWYALACVYLLKKEKELCYDTATECIQLNPYNTELVIGASFVMICAGYFDEGFALIERSIKLNPGYPWWVDGGICFYYIAKRNYINALRSAMRMKEEKTFWDPLLKATCLSYLGRMEEANKYIQQLIQLEPHAPSEIEAMLSTIIISEELIAQMITGLNNAGLNAVKPS